MITREQIEKDVLEFYSKQNNNFGEVYGYNIMYWKERFEYNGYKPDRIGYVTLLCGGERYSLVIKENWRCFLENTLYKANSNGKSPSKEQLISSVKSFVSSTLDPWSFSNTHEYDVVDAKLLPLVFDETELIIAIDGISYNYVIPTEQYLEDIQPFFY